MTDAVLTSFSEIITVEFSMNGIEDELLEILYGGLPLMMRRLPAKGEN
jgi:hypothetical protein